MSGILIGGNLKTDTFRGKMMGHKRMAIYKPRRETGNRSFSPGPQKEPTQPIFSSWTFRSVRK